MKTSKFERTLSTYVGPELAKNYLDSAPMFLAKVHSDIVKWYWIESTQYESQIGELGEREYHLKCCLGTHVHKVKTFHGGKEEALEFFNNIEFTKENALVVERLSGIPRNIFDAEVQDYYRSDERLYDNGYAAFFSHDLLNRAISYCEGDVVKFHCGAEHIQAELKKRHLTFHQENNE